MPYGRENTRRTLIPPKFRDDFSFRGNGRWLYQRFNANALGQPEPDSEPKPGAPMEPGSVRG